MLESNRVLTAHHHHSHRENLLAIRGRSDVAKPDGGETRHGEVQRGDVQRVLVGPPLPLSCSAGVVAVRSPDAQGQLVEPAVCLNGVGGLIDDLMVPDAVPDAGQPVSHQAEDTHQQNQDGRSVLQVVVQLPGHSAQPEQADHLEGAEQAAETLQRGTDGRRESHCSDETFSLIINSKYFNHPLNI